MELLLEPAKTKAGLSPNKTIGKTAEKNAYCGVCPQCKMLQSSIFLSPVTAANALSKFKAGSSPIDKCSISYLQKNYGNSFTGEVIMNLSKSSSGNPLDSQTRSFMEARMGQSFGDVKIYTDQKADISAKNLNAQAYTSGKNIYFASGKYKPENTEGKKLIAHELAHVAQNKMSNASTAAILNYSNTSSPGDAAEAQADAVSTAVVKGMTVPVSAFNTSSPAGIIYRKDDSDGEKSGVIVDTLNDIALGIPGFMLLTVILGKNPITNKAVDRSAKNLLGGVAGLIPGGAILFKNLDESGAIDAAFDWVNKELQILDISWESIKALLKRAWDEISIWYGLQKNISIVKNIFGPVFDRIINFAVKAGKKLMNFIFEGVLKLAGAPVQKIMGMLNKAGDAVSIIAADPVKFIKNLLDALAKGFNQFSDKIWEHLKQGLMEWLFGSLASVGITLPKSFDLVSIITLILQIMGISKESIRKKAVKVIGEKNVELLEKAWEFITTLITKGISGLWEMLKEYVGNLKDMVIDGIKEWVVTKIITAAVMKLVSMFNPVGAIITAIQTIYNTVMFFIERMQQIIELVDTIFQSIYSIATGNIQGAANWVEKAMAKTLPVIISFLARLIGLGGIVDKIKELITKFQTKVDNALEKVITKVADKIKVLLAKVQDAAGSVVEWWKKKVTIIAGTKKGKVFFQGDENTAQIMVSFSPEITYEEYVDYTTKYLASNLQDIAPANVPVINAALATVKKKGKEFEDARKARKSNVKKDAILDEIAAAIKVVEEKRLEGRLNTVQGAAVPKSDTPLYGPLAHDDGGTSAEVRILTSEHEKGSSVDDDPPIMTKLGSLRHTYPEPKYTTNVLPVVRKDFKSPSYVQGHLLNNHLGGVGKRQNLSPITNSANGVHRSQAETIVKDKVNNKNAVHYKVQAVYGSGRTVDRYNEAKAKIAKEKIKIKPGSEDEKILKEFEAETKLATHFLCTAKVISTYNTKTKTWDKKNEDLFTNKVIENK